MSEPLRVAVIGAGHLGRHHARILSGLDGARLTAVVDMVPERAEAAAAAAGARALSDYRARMEQYFQDNRNYGSGTTCGVALPTGAAAKYFNYGCTPSTTPMGYVMTATGSSGNAVGHEYTINQNGDRTTTRFKGASVTATCWLTKDTSC